MHPAFQHDSYFLKRQALTFTTKIRLFDPTGRIALYVEQKPLRLKDDIRVYDDETASREILIIKARTIVDFSPVYDVIDPVDNTRVGGLRREGFKSIARDRWDVLDQNEQPVGRFFEEGFGLALLRRDFGMVIGDIRVADYRRRFNPFSYQMDIDFTMDQEKRLDRRLGTAAAMVLSVIEERQQ